MIVWLSELKDGEEVVGKDDRGSRLAGDCNEKDQDCARMIGRVL